VKTHFHYLNLPKIISFSTTKHPPHSFILAKPKALLSKGVRGGISPTVAYRELFLAFFCFSSLSFQQKTQFPSRFHSFLPPLRLEFFFALISVAKKTRRTLI
jgi:hypothetical protein